MKKNKNVIAIFIVILLIISGSYFILLDTKDIEKNELERIVPFNIWDYQNQKSQPTRALILKFEYEEWQASAGACLVPVYINHRLATPIIFDDGFETREVGIPHDVKSIKDFGIGSTATTGQIATTYWTKAEIVVVADNYEHVLWSVPIASFLAAPILINPNDSILKTLGTKCVLSIGEKKVGANVDTIIYLNTKEEVWRFQIELYESKGQKCNYIIITNPNDTDYFLNPNVKWPYLSLASAPLAAFRNAVVQTGDYTANRTNIDKIAQGMKKDDEAYEQVKPYFEMVKKDCYYAERFLLDHNHNPKFLALVGGSYTIPDYIFDFHINYFYWSGKIDYIFSTAPYGDIENILEYDYYPQQELGVGRIIGHSILDATVQLTRTFFYDDFLAGGRYSSLMPNGWENKASVVEGHRVNQPNAGGPSATPDNPYVPAGEIYDIFSAAEYQSTYYLPRNITDISDNNPPINEILDRAVNSSLILINAHGGVPGKQTLLEIGIDRDLESEYLFTIDGNEIIKKTLVPSLVYLIGCDTGSIAFDFDKKEDYLTLGFIHAGAVAYIAPETYQTICYWDQAPFGPEASQAIYFFQNLLSQNLPIGTALKEAKWKAYLEWENSSSNKDEVGPLTVKLYGDPAFKPYVVNTRGPARAGQSPQTLEIHKSRKDQLNKKLVTPIELLWDESLTITGIVECGNVSIKNFGRLIIKDADLTIRGIINISDFGTLFVFNSTIRVEPPQLIKNLSVLRLSGNALVRFFNSNVILDPPLTPTIAPFILSEGNSMLTFINGNLTLNLPSIPRNTNKGYAIEEYVPGTAGILFLIEDTIWNIDKSNIFVNLNYKRIVGQNILIGAWYFGTLQGNTKLKFNNVNLEFELTQNLFEPIKGSLEIINSRIEGSILSGGITELVITNSTMVGEVAITDQSVASITNSRIKMDVIIGMFSESELTPEPNVEITNSIIEKGISSRGMANARIFNTSIMEGAYISENSSIIIIDTLINGIIVQENNGIAKIINSTIKSITLKDKSQIYIENALNEIDSIIIFYDCNSTISLIDTDLERLIVYPGDRLDLSLINSSIFRLRTYWNITLNMKLIDSNITNLVNSGDNNYFSFTIKNSTRPQLPYDEKITTYIKYLLEVHISFNNNPISTKVEVNLDENVIASGFTDEKGEIVFPLIHKVISSKGNQTFEKYQVKTSYMGFSETEDLKFNQSLEVRFNLIDTSPPEITDINYDPELWNSDWQVTVQATIIDNDIKAMANATIIYSTDGGRTWKEVQMNYLGGDKYQGIIPSQNMGTDVQFYITANDRAGNMEKSSIKSYNVGYETIIFIYVLAFIIICIVAVLFKKWITNHQKVKRYYLKKVNSTKNLLTSEKNSPGIK